MKEKRTLNNSLMISVSGIRGIVGEAFTPEIALEFGKAFGVFSNKGKIALGRDSRVTGDMIKSAVISGLLSMGCEVVDLGIVPTPTLLLYVKENDFDGGIVITASHNPVEWNALKLVHKEGRFLNGNEGAELLKIIMKKNIVMLPGMNIKSTLIMLMQ